MAAHLIAEEGPLRGLILDLQEGDDWIVGRDPDESDFIIEDSTVSRKHARLTKAPEGIYLKNVSRINPTLINGEVHEERVLLKEGDRVQIGNTTFLFSEEDVPNVEAPKKPKSKKKKKAEYDNIFGSLEEEEPPPPLVESEKPAPPEEEPVTEPLVEHKESEPNAYDTIFDDVGAESEIPFNMISEAPLLLKVISGPNAGAEIGIEKGRTYILGKDPNSCDIVFQDLSVSRNHARLHVSPDGILQIEDLGSKNGTVVNGQPILERSTVTPQDMISLGTTVFLIIDREAPQETIYSPIAPHFEAPRAEEPEEAPVLEEAPTPPAEFKDWKREKIPLKYLVGGGSALFVLLIVFLSFFSLFKSEQIQLVKKEPVEEISEALKKFAAVKFSFNPASGKIFLVGHVVSPIEYQEMRYNIDQIPFISSVEDTVVIDELVSKSINDALVTNSAWQGVNVSSPEAGKFIVTGYLPTNADAQRLSDYLTMNFPYLDKLSNQVAVEENLTTQISALFVAHGFGSLSFQLSNGEVIISGPYSDKMESELKDVVKQLNALSGIHGVKNFAVAAHPDSVGIDVSQQYQVSGSSSFDGHGYSVVLNGRIYTLGDLVDGMKITSIESNTILLEKDGLKYKINYTR
ncbi:MAG: type III secretion system inner membrane ring subunit SctD [Verrucomicrobia bacterium]|nr:type III secretion system inner membrane ring subunit SctD [Verrucomicrobiota bacterium]